MGWNTLAATRPSELSTAWRSADVYFAHSFAAEPEDGAVVAATVDHGGPIVAAVEAGPLAGVQFHPERSGRRARVSSRTSCDGQEARDPVPRRRRRPRRQGRQLRKPAGDGRAGRARAPLLRARGRRAGLPRHHGHARRPRADPRHHRPGGRGADDPVHRRRWDHRVGDARDLLLAGADKVAINRAAYDDPEILTALAGEFGAQAVVCAIDARGGEVVTHAGREPRGRDAVDWAREAVERGAVRDPAHVDRYRRDAGGLRPGADPARSWLRSRCR